MKISLNKKIKNIHSEISFILDVQRAINEATEEKLIPKFIETKKNFFINLN